MQEGMSADDVSAVFAERISPRLVDLKTGHLLDKDPAKYNRALALKDPQMSLTLEASQDPAGIKRRSNLAEIYLVRDPKTHSGSGASCLRQRPVVNDVCLCGA